VSAVPLDGVEDRLVERHRCAHERQALAEAEPLRAFPMDRSRGQLLHVVDRAPKQRLLGVQGDRERDRYSNPVSTRSAI
jgi:hypothetical protein